MKTKYYRYVNENINLREKNKHLNFTLKKELKNILKECRERYGFGPQTAYLKERFIEINEMLEKNS
ncbi:MAG TPA: hypothetical protein DCM40_20900 [Maribacter sp.]|nr:hypothetical protein [Maribacter sp.]